LLSASSLLAACGGHAQQQSTPHLPKSSAAQLIALAQAVARDARSDGCTARSEIVALSAKTRELVANGNVPLRLRTPLLNGVTALAAEAPACTPPPAPSPSSGENGKNKAHHGHGDNSGNGGNGGNGGD
jgi:hypothetical protein